MVASQICYPSKDIRVGILRSQKLLITQLMIQLLRREKKKSPVPSRAEAKWLLTYTSHASRAFLRCDSRDTEAFSSPNRLLDPQAITCQYEALVTVKILLQQ